MRHDTHTPGRTAPWLPVVLIGLLALAAGCSSSSPAAPDQSKEIIIFVDFSESVRGENWALFQQDLRRSIIPSLSAGDRIVVAPINDRTLTHFHPLVEATLPEKPRFNGFMDNVLRHNREVKAVEKKIDRIKEEVYEKLDVVFGRSPGSHQTDIFSSLVMAQKIFDREPRQKVLILMSDMIVDYPPYRFDRIRWSADKNEAILNDLEAKGMLPDLSNVCVYVSGVSAASADQAGEIGRFWQAYFKRARADMDPRRYAHVLLHWPPAKSCSWPDGRQA